MAREHNRQRIDPVGGKTVEQLMEELLNCAEEICCASVAKAQAALARMYELDECRTPEDFAACTLEYFTLAPRSFAVVKQEIARLARQ